MTNHRRPDVVIIGGGAIGCATARELTRRGADVLVLERRTPGEEATWAAGGMLSPVSEARRPGPFLDLALASLERFPAFVAGLEEEAGLDIGYRGGGKLHVALDESQAQELDDQLAWRSEQGLAVQRLDGAEARRLEPGLTPATVAALLVERDHQVDNRVLGRALWLAAARAGVRFELGETVLGVAGAKGVGSRVRGVLLAGGELLEVGSVVVAAGCWSGRLTGLPRALPVFPVRGQMAAVDVVPSVLGRVVLADGCYLIPRASGRILIGATTERVGYRCHATPEGIATLLRAAVRAVPSLGDAPLVESWAGLRPGTPDELPILGRDPTHENLFYATGHYRNGILLTPITAAVLSDLIADEQPVIDVRPFAVDRFDQAGSPDPDRETGSLY